MCEICWLWLEASSRLHDVTLCSFQSTYTTMMSTGTITGSWKSGVLGNKTTWVQVLALLLTSYMFWNFLSVLEKKGRMLKVILNPRYYFKDRKLMTTKRTIRFNLKELKEWKGKCIFISCKSLSLTQKILVSTWMLITGDQIFSKIWFISPQ